MRKYFLRNMGFCNKYDVLVAASQEAVEYCEEMGYERITRQEAVKKGFVDPESLASQGIQVHCGIDAGMWWEDREYGEPLAGYREKILKAAARYLDGEAEYFFNQKKYYGHK